ncbi:ABC transporter permease [Mesorhizobium sp. L-8-10]|uniref:ABC transporter permease n=2 Tax=Mesorhizobium sp. L-8-10 TaxID=2744523 RepID=UPI0019291ACF|nr:ABC transporter permease [Mesorhizobium sp. L-8-10]BCH34325.1 ABC transporter permease [Mesorhizobium sp. L-8-10]
MNAPMPPQDRYAVLDAPPHSLRDVLLRWEVILVILLAATVVVNTIVSPYFLDVFNLADATFNFSEKAIIALAMALLILVRQIDLSVAAIVALAAMAIGYAAEAGFGPFALFAVGIGVGLLCGIFNGFVVTWFSLPSIVITIGTMSLFRGLTQVILGDQAKTKYPQEFLDLGQSYFIKMKETGIPWLFVPPVPLSFLIFLVLAVLFGLFLHKTAVGRQLFAIGSNPVAARFSGIPVDRLRFLLFVTSGALSGLAATLLTARLGSMRSNIGVGWELDIVTMVILGGVSIAGGVGSILGVVLAVLVLGLVTFGMSLNNIPGQVVSVYIGALLIAVIAIPRIVDKIRIRPVR